MNKSVVSLTALCATAALFAVPTAASAASVGTITVKAPSCSKSSTAKVTLTAKPGAGLTVIVIAAGPSGSTNPANIYFQHIYNPTAAGNHPTRVLSGNVPVGKKIDAVAGFSDGSAAGGSAIKTFTVKKCAKKPVFTG